MKITILFLANLFAFTMAETANTTTTTIESIPEQLNQSLSNQYLFALAGLVALLIVYRTILYVHRHTRLLACINNDTQKYFALQSVELGRVKNVLLYAPLFGKWQSRQIRSSSSIRWGKLPSRVQTTFILAILATNITLCVVDISWSQQEIKLLPVLRNRSGTISVANLIPIMIMTTVKNPLISILDISYDHFNLMHRWFAIPCVVEAAVHTTCHIMKVVEVTSWKAFIASIPTTMIWTGLAAMIALLLILVQSASALRHAFYEFFLHFHITLIIFTLVVLWMHLDGTKQQNLLLAAIMIWMISRLLRLTTLIYRSVGRGGCKAQIEALPGDALRISLTTPHPWTYQPGQYIYLTIPSVGLWTAHPFSIAWNDFQPPLTRADSLSSEIEKEKVLPLSPIDPESNGKQVFSIIVRKRTGFTKKLYNYAERECAIEGHVTTLKACIEGPYGPSRPLTSYGTLLLISGGVGITHQISYLKSLIQAYKDKTTATRRVLLIWAIRGPECLEWVRPWMTEILGMEGRRDVLRIEIYITRPEERGRREIKSPSGNVQILMGRPDVKALLSRETAAQIGCMGVSVCGPEGLVAETREAVRREMGNVPGRNIEFMAEGFGW